MRHAPTVSPAPVAGAQSVSVAVEPRDQRTSNRDRVSVKKNGYGMEMAAIIATNDIVAELGRVVQTTLEGMGFQTGQARVGTVTVDIHKIWNDFKLGFWSGQAVSEINATVTVRSRDGRIAYTRMFSAESILPEIMIMSGENARLSLVRALDRLGQQIAADRDLAQALAGLAGSAHPPTAPGRTATPPPPPRQIIPRGGVPLT